MLLFVDVECFASAIDVRLNSYKVVRFWVSICSNIAWVFFNAC